MPQVLTTNALITCPHGGQGKSTPSSLKWSVNGGFVLLENDVGTFVASPLPCVFIPPCVGYQLKSMGLNATQIDGRKVMLATDFNQTLTKLPLTIVETHQVIDNSTPAPIPPGQPAPPLSPALSDFIAPVVTGVSTPPTLTFGIAANTPATASITFTLVSAHPLKWILTLLNEPLNSHKDLTNGEPPGLTVTPSGGDWSMSPLSVTVIMNANYMKSLTIGNHRFYMTGVSQRGLSKSERITLQVAA